MRPRRLPLAHQEAADKALQEVQQAGIIEPSESPWASPIVMVPNKGGQWRFCVDYRWLNEVTRKGSYPLPRIDEVLDLVTGSSWFSSLGLRSGYLQLLRGSPGGLELHVGEKLHPGKCHFMRRAVVFLGHKVGEEGISTMGDKVQAVRD
ncbi:hypothetical protein AAFF_G00289770 [Aldrovandia affinis]|uniref:Reverse transcriptase domain-containing protein n=1 Tax=Aldrovandia affinis TaxID=143900 RepID=A0AAD7RA81_9TELE|nr:hypothetical protein AAFF_G00289770 [Aldrovandia affinis]